ncbi:MAG: PEP-CTERM sorting domain-containing protein [Candidatus Brocadiia bacterium]
MKKLVLFGLVALVAIGLAAPPASAVTLPPGYLAASAVDQSSLFEYDEDTETWSPIATGSDPAVDQEQRTVFSVDAVNFGSLETTSLGPRVAGGSEAVPGYVSNTLAGLVYDLEIIGTEDAEPFDDIAFGPGARYTSTGGTDGTWTDMNPSPSYGAVATDDGFGGLLVAYEVSADSADFAGAGGGQDDWLEAAHAATADGALTAQDGFPTISGTEPWLIAVFGPLNHFNPAVPGATVLYERGTDEGWAGVGYAKVIGGTFANMIVQDAFGPWRDLRLDFKVSVPFDADGNITLTEDGWQTLSEDPISLAVIPEPATMSLLGLGLLGLAGVGFRKKK